MQSQGRIQTSTPGLSLNRDTTIVTHPTFLQELETVYEILGRLSESPFFLEACQLALDDGEMTLGDALTAVDWFIGKFEDGDHDTPT